MSTSHKAAPIRRAEAAQLPAVRTVLAGAFETSALMRWALPDDATRRDAVAAWLGPLLDRYLVVGRVDVAEDDEGVVAVAAWRPPAPLPDDPVLHSSPSSAGVLAAILGVERSQRVLEILSGTGQYAPDEPVHYLHLLAVRPGAKGAATARGSSGTRSRSTTRAGPRHGWPRPTSRTCRSTGASGTSSSARWTSRAPRACACCTADRAGDDRTPRGGAGLR